MILVEQGSANTRWADPKAVSTRGTSDDKDVFGPRAAIRPAAQAIGGWHYARHRNQTETS